ncbi:MAG: hypothetical protein JWN46_2146 [Acidimicrobiales bacterium]|nr:hypothetical protein [Acidimicrobiales bacterium]
MEKIIYAMWRAPQQDPAVLADALLADAAPALLDAGVLGLRVNVEAPEARAMRWGANADGSLLAATVGVWLPSIDDRADVEAALDRAPVATRVGYVVTESVPLAYERIDWPLGSRSPGVSIVTLFHKRAGLSDEEYFAVWHGEQTPISFELHPITLYMRNAVWRTLPPGSERFRGLVEECVPTLDDLLDLDRFYSAGGDAGELRRRMAESMAVHDRFTDMSTLQMVPCAEHLFRVVST